jgi:2OG-Fe(II) oxygenase superfamily
MWPRCSTRSPEMSTKIALNLLETAATGDFPRSVCCACRTSRRFGTRTTNSDWRRTPTRISSPACRSRMSRGLYIRPPGGSWLKATRIPGSLIINSGDICRRWTNDRFLSTEHLAVNLTHEDRHSTPFFYTPHIDHPIVCLPTCCDAANPPKYPPITYGEYRVWWLDKQLSGKPRAPRLHADGGRKP